ncbi:hypothetical protein METBIDRAFT_93706 [Metschnikowia bicuspidata var. bicuspidata NRRL YB-4993]|uniref:Uncharacterized protein n=1 Tax=Metschnikowia bicuspidata var. bicuspidata NRRL YB-4993 TaxID=869754 RepID=A0A1A0HFD6_9ASCO|nr:hypothetical protein METBIDRAFT_93706 [Metschnikowia bicuspidata var. bicuspidata NRRL YB-4993]OBA22859.1 hypothetical protein METBIDRAFT_93706 [Metschnikowia bicuspidata var. bicuspidata NRRL YB-4993]
MSMNTYVRSYIHQHNLSFANSPHVGPDSYGVPQKSGHSSPWPTLPQPTHAQNNGQAGKEDFWKPMDKLKVLINPRSIDKSHSPTCKRSPLSSRFPFNECTDITLRESKISIDAWLRQFVSSRSSIASAESLRSFLQEANFTTNSTDSSQPESMSENLRSISASKSEMNSGRSGLNLASSAEISPILVSPTPENESRRRLMQGLNECFHGYLSRKSAVNFHDNLLHDTATFLTNMFIQGFLASETRDLCLEIIESMNLGEIETVILSLIEEAEMKHIEQGFDDFQDLLSEHVMLNTNELLHFDQAEHPRLYQKFKEIWRLNPHAFLNYSLGTLLSFGSRIKNRPFSNISIFHTLLISMEEEAQNMNLIRFYYAFRREIQADRETRPKDDWSLLKEPICHAVESSMALMMESGEIEEPRTYKKEKVRFVF